MNEVYYIDNELFKHSVSDHRFLLKPLNELAAAYNDLGIVPGFSRELLLKAVNSEAKFIGAIRENLQRVLKKTTLPKAFHAAFDAEIDEQLAGLKHAVDEVKRHREISMIHKLHQNIMIDFEVFDVIDNQVVIPEKSIDKLRENATIRVKTEAQEQIIEFMLRANEYLDKVKTILEANNVREQMLIGTWEHPGALRLREGNFMLNPEIFIKVREIPENL
jgi:hypothetical protein